jgi:hypothetical protein
METPKGIKLASLSVNVPYKGAGNVIRQHEIPFDVYKEEALYKAVPQLSKDERRKANLPEELVFFYENGKPRSPRKIDGNFHVIEDIVAKLQQTSVLDAFTAD